MPSKLKIGDHNRGGTPAGQAHKRRGHSGPLFEILRFEETQDCPLGRGKSRNSGDTPGKLQHPFAPNPGDTPGKLQHPFAPNPGDTPGCRPKSFALKQRRSVPWRLVNPGIVLALGLAMALTAYAQTAEEIESPAVTRVVDKLACTCGCKMSMACQMDPYPGCKVCYSHRLKVLEMQKAGMSDQAILSRIVQDEGKAILLTPPGIIGSLSFYTAGILGLILVLFVIRKYRQKGVAAVAVAAETDDPALSRYHDQIEKETAKLE